MCRSGFIVSQLMRVGLIFFNGTRFDTYKGGDLTTSKLWQNAVALPHLWRTERKRKKQKWCFQKAWLRKPECEDLVSRSWTRWGGSDCGMKLNSICQNMGKEISMSRTGLRRQIVDFKNQLESLMWSSHLEEGIEQLRRVNMNIEELEAQEEEMWVQQSRQNWLTG